MNDVIKHSDTLASKVWWWMLYSSLAGVQIRGGWHAAIKKLILFIYTEISREPWCK